MTDIPLRRKKILIHSDFSLAKTGFGKNARNILTYLYKTGKYDLIHYVCNMSKADPSLQVTPWKSIGCLPNLQQEVDQHLARFKPEEREQQFRLMCYGENSIDEVIKNEAPDVYIGTQDIWGVDYSIDRTWFRKLNGVIWTTLDSLPLLDIARDKAPKIKNYWLWSSFATKELHRLGYTHAKTVHGPINTELFYRLTNEQRTELRKLNNIPQDAFIIGFVFRNQLRKSVPNMLQGYKIWRDKNPNVKAYLLFHTFWGEGWNIHKRADEFGINKNEILTTHICKTCKNYEVKPFNGHDVNCRFCGDQKGQVTTNVNLGVYEDQLNEVYNLMDVYCHPFTSGGQEIPIQEAKLTELISLVTNYSCGEELCEQPFEESGTLPLNWAEYREHGTEFIKASTFPESIASNIELVYKLPPESKRIYEKTSRQWTINNYSVNVVGKQIEVLLDEMPFIENKWQDHKEPHNPNAIVPFIIDNYQWVKTLYREILKLDVDQDDSGVKDWMSQLKSGVPRERVEQFFRQTAANELVKKHNSDFNNFLDKNDNKRILIVLPESLGDVLMSTALLKSIRERYPRPEWTLYFATKIENFEILDGNEFIDKVIHYIPEMDNHFWVTGINDHKGFFDVTYQLHFGTQRMINYVNNGKDIHGLELKTN